MPLVHVRYWAGAARAAGTKQEDLQVSDLAGLRAALAARPELESISSVASFLVDGQQTDERRPLDDGDVVDVLPPFAGG